jgi:antirestriction protein
MSLDDVAVTLVEEGIFGTISQSVLIYFDFEKLGRDLGYDGYDEQDNGVFCYN